MDTPASSYNDEFTPVDQVLHRLFRAPDVVGGIFNREKTRGRLGSPVSMVNLGKDLCRDLRRELGYEEFVEHCLSYGCLSGIAALKTRNTAAEPPARGFEYNPDEPLRLKRSPRE
jgi:hypothetical protein